MKSFLAFSSSSHGWPQKYDASRGQYTQTPYRIVLQSLLALLCSAATKDCLKNSSSVTVRIVHNPYNTVQNVNPFPTDVSPNVCSLYTVRCVLSVRHTWCGPCDRWGEQSLAFPGWPVGHPGNSKFMRVTVVIIHNLSAVRSTGFWPPPPL